MLNSSLRNAHWGFRLTRETMLFLPLCFFLIPKKSVFGVHWGSLFPEVILRICLCVTLDHTDFAALLL